MPLTFWIFFNLNSVLSVSQHMLSGINPSAYTAAVFGIAVCSSSHQGLNEALTSKKCILVNKSWLLGTSPTGELSTVMEDVLVPRQVKTCAAAGSWSAQGVWVVVRRLLAKAGFMEWLSPGSCSTSPWICPVLHPKASYHQWGLSLLPCVCANTKKLLFREVFSDPAQYWEMCERVHRLSPRFQPRIN